MPSIYRRLQKELLDRIEKRIGDDEARLSQATPDEGRYKLIVETADLYLRRTLARALRRSTVLCLIAYFTVPVAVVLSIVCATPRYDGAILSIAFLLIIAILSWVFVLRDWYAEWRDKDWRFSVRTLLIVTTVVAVSLGTVVWASKINS